MFVPAAAPPLAGAGPASSVLWGTASLAGAILLAAGALYRERTHGAVRRVLTPAQPVVTVLRALHSGVVGDYVTWLVAGVAVLGGLFAIVVR